jgi:rhodanese-related sulfurtransferase/transcriptional regulator with XRE-family HTH domain
MARILELGDVAALVAAGDLDIVDVREPDEWRTGHVPGARLVPLGELRADPRAKLPRDRVLFVCATGARSLTAASLAERAGLTEVYSLDGGTLAWARAGLPLEAPEAPVERSASVTAAEAEGAGDGASCGLPEPTLDAVVGANLRALRGARDLSLDALARLTGHGRSLLGQIENGRASPSVSVVWKIARAFDVPFSALLANADRSPTSVMRSADARRLVSPDGRFSSRALYPLEEPTNVEFYELFLAAHSREDAAPHRQGTRENLIVTAGRLELEVDGVRHELGKGDAIAFTADVPHAYVNPGAEDCSMYLVMTYASDRR